MHRNNNRLGRPGAHPSPALSLHQCRQLLADIPTEQMASMIEQAIDSTKCPSFIRAQLTGADYSSLHWCFFALDLASKYGSDLSAFMAKG